MSWPSLKMSASTTEFLADHALERQPAAVHDGADVFDDDGGQALDVHGNIENRAASRRSVDCTNFGEARTGPEGVARAENKNAPAALRTAGAGIFGASRPRDTDRLARCLVAVAATTAAATTAVPPPPPPRSPPRSRRRRRRSRRHRRRRRSRRHRRRRHRRRRCNRHRRRRHRNGAAAAAAAAFLTRTGFVDGQRHGPRRFCRGTG